MRALVISGGGSRGAFAGGVAQYLVETMGFQYDIMVGSSTGSLLISHLALNKIRKIKQVFTSVDQSAIFSICPFSVNTKGSSETVHINHAKVAGQFLRGSKTFGESYNLRKLIFETFTEEEFNTLKKSGKDIVVTVSNLSRNSVEYKSIKDCNYANFCEWIWISCNFIPFMTLVEKNGYEYADGGFGSKVPIEEAVNRGAKIVDVIILDNEVSRENLHTSKNVFTLLTHLNMYMAERISRQNIRIGKLVAKSKGASLNFYYTPVSITSHSTSLVFDSKQMTKWWEMGFHYAGLKNQAANEVKSENKE